MFVEIRKVGKRKKYYLVHSFRVGKKVKKIRRFLGTNLSSQKLDPARIVAEKQILHRVNVFKKINDPLLEVLSEEEISQIKELQNAKALQVFHLTEDQWLRFSEIFTYNTNAIEGSALTQKEVINIAEKGKWPQDKSKEDIAEAQGVIQAIAFIRQTQKTVSVSLIKEVHHIVFKNSKSFAGKLRQKGIEVVVYDSLGNVVHQGAPSEKVLELLHELEKWYAKFKNKYPPLLLAAVVHNQFENIHPFQDGNGRVGRILMNNVLLKHHLPPINVNLKNRRRYYQTLQEYEKNHNIRPTIEFLLDEYKDLRKRLKVTTKK